MARKMKDHFALILIVLLVAFTAAAQEDAVKKTDSPSKTETLLRVEIESGKSYELKAADLAKLPRREIKAKTQHGEAEAVFSGTDLREVLKLAGVKFGDEGKKANLVSYLLVEAADGYRVIFSMIELEPDFTDKIILLADRRDGKPLSKEEGSVRLIVPDEKKQARSVRQVIVLRVKKI